MFCKGETSNRKKFVQPSVRCICFKKCTQCVVIENQHSNYCKVTKKKIGNGNHVFIVVSWEYDDNCAKKCAFITILSNRI